MRHKKLIISQFYFLFSDGFIVFHFKINIHMYIDFVNSIAIVTKEVSLILFLQEEIFF